MKKTPYIFGAAFLSLALIIIFFAFSKGEAPSARAADTITVFKTPTCGCCSNYVSYLKREGFKVQAIDLNSLSDIKNKYGITPDMESCHTSVIGNKVIEGHVPAEVIDSFLADENSPRAIALPEMPSGSPGMPGSKIGKFKIFALNQDSGEKSVYLEY